jgi:hypothetical protein
VTGCPAGGWGREAKPRAGFGIGDAVALDQVLDGVAAAVTTGAPGLGAKAGPAPYLRPDLEAVRAAAAEGAGAGVFAALPGAGAFEHRVAPDQGQ